MARAMNLEKAVNHGGHSEHGEKARAGVGFLPIRLVAKSRMVGRLCIPVGRVSPTGVTRQTVDAVADTDVGLRCANPTYKDVVLWQATG
jgi:hypothetical protein